MFTAQGNTLATLGLVRDFLDEHAAQLPSAATSGARRRLGEVLLGLATHTTEQSGQTIAGRGAVKKKTELRATLLRDHMRPIALVAQAELPHTAELHALRMPRNKPSLDRLAAMARGMAVEAAKYRGIFTRVGLPADFVEQLEAATQEMLDVRNASVRSRGRVKGATDSVRSLLREARQVLAVLDVLVRKDAPTDTRLLGDWARVKKISKAPVHSVAVADTAPATATAIPTSTPAAA